MMFFNLSMLIDRVRRLEYSEGKEWSADDLEHTEEL